MDAARDSIEADPAVDGRFPAEGMDCPSCASTASHALLGLDGVLTVDPDIISQSVRVRYDPHRVDPGRIRRSISGLGYGASAPAEHGSKPLGSSAGADTPVPPTSPIRALLVSTPAHIWAGALLWALTIGLTLAGAPAALVATASVATVLVTGRSVFPGAWAGARSGTLDMHVLMAVAAIGALGIGEFVEAGAVLFLFAVARELEHRALQGARSEVRSLMDLTPVSATVFRHGHQVVVPAEAVREGEIVLVRPGERVPVDGTVAGGSSEVDASTITGEPMPEPRFQGDRVYAGSVNGRGALEVRCDVPVADSALSHILRNIEEARARKSATEAFVDRFARIYTPLVMAGALGLAVLPPLVAGGEWSEWGYRALVLVVVACPCALVISTPVTVVSALTGAVREGILVKSGIHLEVLGRTRTVALDKTGTVTEGAPSVSRVLNWGAESEAEVLAMAAAAESRSEHPIARAIQKCSDEDGIHAPGAVEMTALPGLGARARVSEREVLVGSPRLFREEDLLGPEEDDQVSEILSRGETVVLVGWGTAHGDAPRLRGAIVLTDRARPDLPGFLSSLRREGVDRIVLMSGDRAGAVEAVGDGFDERRGDLLPDEKVAWIRELRAKHGPVLMVGDGANDAPALAESDVGMAMARRGTAVAVDAADIALMEDDLTRIPVAFRLGRKAARIIRANIGFALLVKVVFVVLGGAGHATLWMAVVADMGSSLAVILNGLRTLRA